MDVVSACPLRVGSIVWRHGPNAWALTVVCKATYVLVPGTSPLAPEQDEIHEGDARWDDDERRSLHAATDLAPFKRRAEVLLVGHAFAPMRQPVPSLLARLIAASVDKTIAVHADRAWGADGVLREGAPFVKMPLRWERAAGGPGTSNPAGVRTGAPLDGSARPLPNLEPPGTRVTSPMDPIQPIGFGPIAPTWPGRTSRLHGLATAWAAGAWTEEPLPGDLDPRFFNAAPPDQEVDELRHGDRIVLENLHPEHARLVTSLEPVRPHAALERGNGGREVVALLADTLSFDSDRGICTLVWRGQLSLWSPAEAGRVVITMERGAEPGAIERTVAAKWSGAPALPFKMGKEEVPAEAMSTMRLVHKNPKPVLPFAEAGPAPPIEARQPIVRPSSEPNDGTGTIVISGAPKRDPLPFVPSLIATDDLPTREELIAPPPEPAPLAKQLPPPPPMIGPLAGLAPEANASEHSPAVADTTVEPPIAEPGEDTEVELRDIELTLEQVSAIAAEIAEGRAPRAEILRGHALTEAGFAANEERWEKALDEEASNGASRLRAAADRAYVAAVETFRGPITLAEYARIAIALERGRAYAVLDELRIQRPALMRIVRLWTKKVALDPKLGKEARAILASLRAGA